MALCMVQDRKTDLTCLLHNFIAPLYFLFHYKLRHLLQVLDIVMSLVRS